MPDHDWTKIRQEYVADSTLSYRKLSKTYGISLRVLSRRAAKEKWPELRRQSDDRVSAEIEKRKAEGTVTTVETILKARDALARKAMEMVETVTRSSDIINLVNALQILAKMTGIQTDLDEKEQKARIASIEAKVQVPEDEGEAAGVIFLPEKDTEEVDTDE